MLILLRKYKTILKSIFHYQAKILEPLLNHGVAKEI